MYKEVPMIKFMILTRIVRLLWSGYDVQKSMAEYFLEGDKTLEKWSSIEESLKLKIVKCLILPNELKIVLSSLVNPIGGHAKKTAEAVIKDNLPITKRYEIACTYCLKDEVLMLWNELPETDKDDYLNAREPIDELSYLPIYWTYYMRGELNRLDRKIREEYTTPANCHCIGIFCASTTANQPAVEYLMGQLSVEEKEEYFKCFFRFVESRELNIYSCDIIFFLLSQMNENQRASIFEKYAFHILNNFLEFPYGGMFWEIESAVQKYLTAEQVKDLEKLYEQTSKYFIFRKFDGNLSKLM
ncbi:ANK_REP_REGION domain-containing protein [Trichonephila inaurata madagascariensis]|uniref:ANK_REP_REGION domain-containing protein n=1 Tax=Trichonephila inaurata madagascariensis TaxID=2747483 RepID=A0A8X6MFY3_9ARAC|nr:ANK_REP_REGION domain-containing protein [Trichonephila inaurata madagascariensis]